MDKPVLDFLLARRSAPIQELSEPGPNAEEIETILRVATRVPDHGMLTPWRFILYRGESRVEVGEKLAELAEKLEGPLSDARRQQELTRFSRAPLVIGVVSSPKESIKFPEWEMFLSGAMVALNLMHAANALGFGTNMITNWYSDKEEGRRILGLAPHERVIGFVHIGSHPRNTPDRPRPDVAGLVSEYSGPWSES
ncbi:nitroreductase [Nitratireductor aestuarii]|uniref:Putative NAD(P)H nitroreductase n=1 Tax=Nitratireductor aestuarii TaxID=1735103 RepID=A0A916VY80_9HYPH|nr:nitroreductase [Nitratireductor aestuarii]GGA52069.1 nitroreductase [Nitratireductor aestuarii]